MTGDGSVRPPGRRAVQLGWIVGAIPFAVVSLLTAVLDRDPADPIRESARLQCRAPIIDLRAATDRAGDHLALVDGTGRVFVAGQRQGVVALRRLSIPWPGGTGRAGPVCWLDLNQDELQDLQVWAQEDFQGDDDVAYGSDQAPACVVQKMGRFELSGFRPSRFSPSLGEPTEAHTLTRAFAVVPGPGPGGGTVLTVGRRLFQSLRGAPLGVRDLNDDGNDEILTAECRAAKPDDHIHYRLYAWNGRVYRVIHSTRLPGTTDISGSPNNQPLAVLTDVDGDGRAELVMADVTAGTVLVQRWVDA